MMASVFETEQQELDDAYVFRSRAGVALILDRGAFLGRPVAPHEEDERVESGRDAELLEERGARAGFALNGIDRAGERRDERAAAVEPARAFARGLVA